MGRSDIDNSKNETPSLDFILNQAIRSRMMDLHVCLPGRVERYDKDKQEVDILPTLKKKYKSEESDTDRPIIPSVPVRWTSADSGKAFIHLPLKIGDIGWLHFSDRSIDNWLSSTNNNPVLPDDIRIHDVSDAYFVPGGLPFPLAFSGAHDDNIIIRNDNSIVDLAPDGTIIIDANNTGNIEISPNGDIVIKAGVAGLTTTMQSNGKFKISSTGDEFLTILVQLVTDLANAFVNTGIGPQPFVGGTVTALNNIITRITAMKAV